MFEIQGYGKSEPLTSDTASQLARCHSVQYGEELGYIIAYGRDKYNKLFVVIHAKSYGEFQKFPQRFN